MAIRGIAIVDASALTSYLLSGIARYEEVLLEKGGDFMEEKFVDDWMGTWDRTYATGRKQGKHYVDVFIDNSGAKAKGSSGYDQRPPRYGVPSYINFGTRRRLATMTQNFTPKTAIGLLKSGPGSGGFFELSRDKGPILARRADLETVKELAKELPEFHAQSWAVAF